MASSLKATQTSIYPKSIHYHSNGSGRDNYITTQCGGLFKEKPERCVGFEIGTFGPKASYKQINNYKPAKHIHYHSDGTGRDNYIVINEGGLAGRSYSRHNHLKGLRTYPKKPLMDKKDLFQMSQTFTSSMKIRKQQNDLYKSQQDMTSRLSQPRINKDPYAEIRAKTSLPGLRRLY